ncbi:hypothetical protein PENSUB_12501 [Penicillium subrubescens]|jgi:hypothetical protein|uniref:Uncharacterized protein n=1 Tax=Penicillium subrubescens TaxID=1316194 RepID=A0A1Q5SZI9_9EURO|nr:hypothetical protein PENSUB_12501 [Penicillium subrubescens]
MDLQDRSVHAAIGHLSNPKQFVGEKPYEIFIDTQPGRPKTNMKFALCDGIPVKDVRFHGREQFSLDKNGFEFVNHSFDDQITINSIKQSGGDAALQSYLKPLQVFLQQHLKADKVILYDWRVASLVPSPLSYQY